MRDWEGILDGTIEAVAAASCYGVFVVSVFAVLLMIGGS